jgi:hypothetical protein
MKNLIARFLRRVSAAGIASLREFSQSRYKSLVTPTSSGLACCPMAFCQYDQEAFHVRASGYIWKAQRRSHYVSRLFLASMLIGAGLAGVLQPRHAREGPVVQFAMRFSQEWQGTVCAPAVLRLASS